MEEGPNEGTLLRETLSSQDAAPRYQGHVEKHQGSYSQIGRSTRRGHPPNAGAGYNVFGVAYVTFRRVLLPNGRRVLAALAGIWRWPRNLPLASR